MRTAQEMKEHARDAQKVEWRKEKEKTCTVRLLDVCQQQ